MRPQAARQVYENRGPGSIKEGGDRGLDFAGKVLTPTPAAGLAGAREGQADAAFGATVGEEEAAELKDLEVLELTLGVVKPGATELDGLRLEKALSVNRGEGAGGLAAELGIGAGEAGEQGLEFVGALFAAGLFAGAQTQGLAKSSDGVGELRALRLGRLPLGLELAMLRFELRELRIERGRSQLVLEARGGERLEPREFFVAALLGEALCLGELSLEGRELAFELAEARIQAGLRAGGREGGEAR